jgi:hypothetical protein
MRRVVKDTYEAAYYMVNGAQMDTVRSIPVPMNKQGRKGYRYQWIMHMQDVPLDCVNDWQSGKATCGVQSLENARRNLKRQVKRSLGLPMS